MARRALPCVDLCPPVRTCEARLLLETIPRADHDLLPVADHHLAVEAEVGDATVAGVTAEHPALKVPQGAQK